jgi:hypothetical protein
MSENFDDFPLQAEMKRDANSRDTSQRMKRNFIGDSEKH